jgi:hypothetical protein
MKLQSEWVDLTFANDSGTGNGSTSSFVTTNDLYSANAIWLSLDGLLLTITTHYTVNVSTNTITFVTAPANGQKISIKYMKK